MDPLGQVHARGTLRYHREPTGKPSHASHDETHFHELRICILGQVKLTGSTRPRICVAERLYKYPLSMSENAND